MKALICGLLLREKLKRIIKKGKTFDGAVKLGLSKKLLIDSGVSLNDLEKFGLSDNIEVLDSLGFSFKEINKVNKDRTRSIKKALKK